MSLSVLMYVAIVSVFSLAAGCGRAVVGTVPDDAALATFKGGEVTAREFREAAGNDIPKSIEERQRMLALLINNRLIARLAHQQEGFLTGPELASEIQDLYTDLLPRALEREIASGIEVTDEEMEAFREPDIAPRLRVKMLVAKSQEDADKALADLSKGKSFEDELKEHPEYFLPEVHTDAEIDLAGSLYPIGMKAALNKLSPGELSPIMKFELGYGIFRVESRIGPDDVWEMKKPAIKKQIRTQKAEAEMESLLRKLYSESDIKYEPSPGGYKAIVDGTTITHQNMMSTQDTDDPHEPHSGMTELTVLSSLEGKVKNFLLSREAKRRGLEQDPDFLREYNLATEKLLASYYIDVMSREIKVTPGDISEYYEKNKDTLASPELVRVSRILCTDAKTAGDIVKKLGAGGDYAELAKRYSEDRETGEKGGDAGWIQVSELKEPVKGAIDALGVGETSPVVKSDYGYEVIMVTEIKPSVVPPLSDVEDTVRKRVMLNKRSKMITDLYGKLYTDYELKIDMDLLKAM